MADRSTIGYAIGAITGREALRDAKNEVLEQMRAEAAGVGDQYRGRGMKYDSEYLDAIKSVRPKDIKNTKEFRDRVDAMLEDVYKGFADELAKL